MASKAKATQKISVADASRILQDLKENPADTTGVPDTVLQQLFNFLVAPVVGKNTSLSYHWFCSQAEPANLEAATFLIRLFAYNSPQVATWKERLHFCVSRCSQCACGLERAKTESRTSYLARFPKDVQDAFFDKFEEWEVECFEKDLTAALAAPAAAEAKSSGKILSKLSSPLLYRMLCNLAVYQAPFTQSLLRSATMPVCTHQFPSGLLPPGLLLLMMHEHEVLRRWAYVQTQAIHNSTPVPFVKFLPSCRKSLALIVQALGSAPGNSVGVSFTNDLQALWSSFHQLLTFIPKEALTDLSTRHIVTSHLHNTGPEFTSILRCFSLLLTTLAEGLWSGEGADYSQVVFDSIKDNSAFSSLILNGEASQNQWSVSWLLAYMRSVSDPHVHGEALAKVADFLLEELQHERFKEHRAGVLVTAIDLLETEWAEVVKREHIQEVVNIHSEHLTSVAFSSSYFQKPAWQAARARTRDFLTKLLRYDIDTAYNAVLFQAESLARRIQKKAPPPDRHEPTVVKKDLWAKVYLGIGTKDHQGIAAIISMIAHTAFVNLLHAPAFMLEDGSLSSADINKETTAAIARINESITSTRSQFSDTLKKCASHGTSSSAVDILSLPGVVKDVTKLMLSPVEDIQSAAQALVGLAFDVDLRIDCFRELLSNHPDATMAGLSSFLKTFMPYASKVPEATSISKSLVRCFTDILDVLDSGSSEYGLLAKDTFLRPTEDTGPAAQLSSLWHNMCNSITVIFKRTPGWSLIFTNEEMTVWMRDALIFGRDLLAVRPSFEAAIIRHHTLKGKSGRSQIKKRMMGDLSVTFPAVARWMQLTDEELLHQSFSLLESLFQCFREAGVPPPQEGIDRLSSLVEKAKNPKGAIKTRLDKARLLKLEVAIAAIDDDDEVEIIEVDIPSSKTRSKVPEKPRASIKAPPTAKLTQKVQLTAGPSNLGKIKPDKFFSVEERQKLDAPAPAPTLKKSLANLNIKKAPAPVHSTARVGSEPASVAESEGSDSDDDSEPEEGGLQSLAKMQKSPKIRKPAERRGIKHLDIPLARSAVAERIANREIARRNALRMRPDLSGLHRVLLSWTYEQTVVPPDLLRSVIPVPNTFKDYDAYRRSFEPLFLLECWQQLMQSKEETQEVYPFTAGPRRHSDDWIDMEITVEEAVRKDWYLAETDIVILRHPDGQKTILAKVLEARSKGGFHAQVAARGIITATLRYLSLNGLDPGPPAGGATWQLSKVLSLSTLQREYAALISLQYYNCCDTVLRPQLAKSDRADDKEIQRTMKAYKVNEPQASAIANALRTDGFFLIQGPPGTGKTSTICGIVSAFLRKRNLPPVTTQLGHQKPPEQHNLQKVLICAPSNAAIDEVASRLHQLAQKASADSTTRKVVRVGADSAIHVSVKGISLDSLVEEKMSGASSSAQELNAKIAGLRQELDEARKKRQALMEELQKLVNNSARATSIDDELKRLNARRVSLSQQHDQLTDKRKSEGRSLDAARRRARLDVLREADIICSTLAGSGHEILEQFDFEMVIIDEAAQAIELSSLIPLKYNCKRCIMVGDPQQLPPTVISQEACRFQYNQSLFLRLQKQRPEAVHLLSIQYRMHPEISRLPSSLFYQGKLKDGPEVETQTTRPWHSPQHHEFGTYKFFDCSAGKEEKIGQSVKNVSEANIAVALYARLQTKFPVQDFRVGVVSMYRAQINELRQRFSTRFGRDIFATVDFNTVDGFQGQEKDVIILSCVRAGPGVQHIGFLADVRRMNVALTRAKSSLFILGNAKTLERSDDHWRQIIRDSKDRNALVDVPDISYFTQPSNILARTPSMKHSPVKTSKAAPKPGPATPSDLMTPKNLKEESHKSGPQSRGVKRRSSVDQSSLASSSLPAPQKKAHTEISHTSHPSTKRKEAPPQEATAVGSSSRPPPKKKPKKDPLASLFINNKKKKP